MLAAYKAEMTRTVGQKPSIKDWIYKQWGQSGLDVFNAWATKNPSVVGTPPNASQTGMSTAEALRQKGYSDAVIWRVDRLVKNAPSGKKDKNGKEIYGSIRNAIINAIRRNDDPVVIAALMDRYDLNPNNPPMKEEDWYKAAKAKNER
jgi:hypothetical protein